VNENGENMDGSKVQFGDLGAIINILDIIRLLLRKI